MMHFFCALLVVVSFGFPAFGRPANYLHDVQKFNGQTSGRFLVRLGGDVSMTDFLARTNAKTTKANITHKWDIVNGFAAHLDAASLEVLRNSPEVISIEEDGILRALNTQTDAPWGLGRISSTTSLAGQDDAALTFSYTYDASAGFGVDIYILDTGVLTTHTQFGGRASWGATFGGYADADGNGHGTHNAGTAAGSQFGVAKASNIIAVKVLSDAGSGAIADIISGINWIVSSAASTGRPSVVSIALGGSASAALDNAVTSATNSGVHIVVAAGGSNTDAGNFSPARAPGAVTVSATDITDARISASNYGSVIALFAPGLNVISAWIGSNTATTILSGTSMSCGYVTGLAAYILGLEGNRTPAALRSRLQELSLKNVLTNIPAGTVNYLSHNV